MWRRAKGSRRTLLHGLIQVAVGYEHLRRGNLKGMRSLLGQGTKKLRYFTRRPGVKALRDRAIDDAERAAQDATLTLRKCRPPKVLVAIDGVRASVPTGAIEIRIPTA